MLCVAAGCAAPHPGAFRESPYRDPATLAEGEILHLDTGRLLSGPELYETLFHYPVVYVGETHDNVRAHAVQLSILKAMHRRFPGEVAVGMEMLRRPHQAVVDAYMTGEVDERVFLRAWDDSWGLGAFPYYRELIDFCRDRGIPVLALNPGRNLEAALLGAPRPADEEAAARLPELDLGDPYYRATLEAYFAAHTGGSGEMERFLRMQVLRDETMAETAAAYLQSQSGAGKRLLVFAGGNHVRYGFGVPRRLYRRLPLPYVVIDTFITHYPEALRHRVMDVALPSIPLRPADFYWAVGYEDLSTGQAALGVRVEELDSGGVRVQSVVPGSAAQAAGLAAGDVILSLDDEPVADSFDLRYLVSRHRPGEAGMLAAQRDGERLEMAVTFKPAGDGPLN
jgi:uncharacterized iron-regulated protein